MYHIKLCKAMPRKSGAIALQISSIEKEQSNDVHVFVET